MKKLLSVILTLAIIICAVPLGTFTFTASAATEYTEGYYTYTVSNGEAMIEKVSTFIRGDIIIPSTLGGYPVTSIGDWAFAYGMIESVIIPNGVEEIGDNAFYLCEKLEIITIPNSVKKIGSDAFTDTAYYKQASNWSKDVLYINNYLIKVRNTTQTEHKIRVNTLVIADNAFCDAKCITDVVIPNGVKYIGDDAFNGCSALVNVDISNTVVSIDDYVFSDCKNLKNITIGNGVSYIGDYAFARCENITKIIIPENVKYIGVAAFSHCNKLIGIKIPDGVEILSDFIFYDCTNLASVTLPNSITIIGESAFSDCLSLTGIDIPNSVFSIGNCAFLGCMSLTNITIPDSVVNIDHSAFAYCDNFEIMIPPSVSSIGADIFYECNNVTVYGYTGSYIEYYAKENDIPFVSIGDIEDLYQIVDNVSVDITGIYKIVLSFDNSNDIDINIPNLPKIFVFDKNGYEVKYNETKDGYPLVKGEKYTLKFLEKYSKYKLVNKSSAIFPDTSASGWYNDAVTYAVGAGIMSGYSNGKFGTSDSIQRQDFLVMLARLDGVNLNNYKYKSSFPDVARNSYYEAAVNWGAQNGIVTGYQNGKFGVGDKVTREQLVTFLYRYAKYKDYDYSYTSDRETIVSGQYNDYKNVSDFAKDPILWAIEKGVISGKTATTIVPQGNAQRCEVAKIMYNIYLNDIFK